MSNKYLNSLLIVSRFSESVINNFFLWVTALTFFGLKNFLGKTNNNYYWCEASPIKWCNLESCRVMNGLSKFCSSYKIWLLLVMLAKFWWAIVCLCLHNYFHECSTASFRKVFVAPKGNFHQCLCSQKKLLVCLQRPFDSLI